MDNVQKSIIGYLLLAVVAAVVLYVTGKLELWFSDPSLLVALAMIIGALATAVRKWIKHSFGLPNNDDNTGEEHTPTETQPP